MRLSRTAILCSLASLASFAALGQARVSPTPSQRAGATIRSRGRLNSWGESWWIAINRLEMRTVNAHIEKSLLSLRRIPRAMVGGFDKLNGITFSRKTFPIRLTAREEWPPVIVGCRSLLARSGYAAAIRDLRPLAAAPVEGIPDIQRVLIQNALWDVFDSLYSEGADPRFFGEKLNHRRWMTLLLWLAHDISHIALSKKNLAAFNRRGFVRRRVLGPKLWRKAVELYSFQQMTIHATALGFRRIVRIYIYDPKVDFSKLSKPQLRLYCRGKKNLDTGSVVIEVEDAIAVSPSGESLIPTAIPVIARSYRVIYSGKGNPMLAFSIFRFPRSATDFHTNSLKRLPSSFGAWALLNLPTIPNGSIGFLAKYPVVCAQCHSPGGLQSFRTGVSRPRRRYFRTSAVGTGYVQMRTVKRKFQSLEFDALGFYCSQPLPGRPRTTGKRAGN